MQHLNNGSCAVCVSSAFRGENCGNGQVAGRPRCHAPRVLTLFFSSPSCARQRHSARRVPRAQERKELFCPSLDEEFS
jgi:hypothetical protein